MAAPADCNSCVLVNKTAVEAFEARRVEGAAGGGGAGGGWEGVLEEDTVVQVTATWRGGRGLPQIHTKNVCGALAAPQQTVV